MDFATSAAQLNCEFLERPCGVKLIDAGVHVCGGFFAGLRIAELSAAGLAKAVICLADLGGEPWPHVDIQTDQAYLGCFISQSGNPAVSLREANAIGSGPACALGH